MSEPFIGQIQTFGFNFAPRGWAKCDGQLLNISQHSALFSLLGTTYGGDGRNTFGLPDLRGRYEMHQGQGPGLSSRSIGSRSGNETTTLAVQNLPAHNHGLRVRDDDPSVGSPSGAYMANAPIFNSSSPNTSMGTEAIQNTGNNQAFNNIPPFLVVNICIALQGIFPSRN